VGAILAVGVAAAAESRLPRLQRDPPLVAETVPDRLAEARFVRPMNAPPEREKQALGFCDYPGPYVPCWCFGGQVNGVWLSDCESAEEYLNDVAKYGPPRNHAKVPLREPERYTLTIEDE
jgi:hypothetical protein